jgi:hypothetical protein
MEVYTRSEDGSHTQSTYNANSPADRPKRPPTTFLSSGSFGPYVLSNCTHKGRNDGRVSLIVDEGSGFVINQAGRGWGETGTRIK